MSGTNEQLRQKTRDGSDALRVLLLALPTASPLNIFGAVEAFVEANTVNKPNQLYDVTVVSTETGKCLWPTPEGDGQFSDSWKEMPVDTLIIIGGLEHPGHRADKRLLDMIRNQSSQARRVVGVSSGTFLLADAGLLKHRRATTHWTLADQLTQAHPNVEFIANRLYVNDGGFYTSAGGSSTIDLALALIRDDFGAEVAICVAKRLVVFMNRSDSQPQVSNTLLAQATEVKALDSLLVWMADNLQANLSVAKLARRVAMSPRNFARQFLHEVGTSPGQYVASMRLDAAANLLSGSTLSLKEIAQSSGLCGTAGLRRRFTKVYGLPPIQYRLESMRMRRKEASHPCGPFNCVTAPDLSTKQSFERRGQQSTYVM